MITRLASSLLVAVLLAAMPGPADAQTSQAYFEFLMARRLEAQGDGAGALAALERAALAEPKSAEIRAEIAALQMRRNIRSDAEKAARAALALNEENVEAHRVLGLIFAANLDGMNGRGQRAQREATAREAIAHLERAIEGPSTTDFPLQLTLGRLYMRVGDSEKAVESLGRVVTDNPNSIQARLSLAQAFAGAGDLEDAIDVLAAVVEDDPRVASSLAQYQEQAGLHKEAAANYTRALTVQPMSRELKFRRVTMLFNVMEYAQAAAFADEARKQHPDDPRFPRLGARALFESGSRDRAFTMLEAAARDFPRDVNTQFALANLYDEAGREADAERTIRQLLRVVPDNPDALNYLGYFLAEKGRQLDEAISLVQRALVAEPDNPSFLDSLGWAYFKRGELQQAEKYLSPAAERMPDNAVVQDHFGDVLAGLGRWQGAIDAWTRALEGAGVVDRARIEKKIADARDKMNK